MWNIKNRINDDFFIKICSESKGMSEACSKLNLHFNSFKKRALELGCYKPNQGGKGFKKNKTTKIKTSDILNGLYPYYQTYKLKLRLIEENIKKDICEKCLISEWMGRKLKIELHHKDGNRHNHLLKNLILLCPNCHSQTDTFRSKNKK